MAEIHPNVPAHLRENLERFAKGCDACGAMSWFAKRAATDAVTYKCGECGQPFVSRPGSPPPSTTDDT